jgi:hypothetical protein
MEPEVDDLVLSCLRIANRDEEEDDDDVLENSKDDTLYPL